MSDNDDKKVTADKAAADKDDDAKSGDEGDKPSKGKKAGGKKKAAAKKADKEASGDDDNKDGDDAKDDKDDKDDGEGDDKEKKAPKAKAKAKAKGKKKAASKKKGSKKGSKKASDKGDDNKDGDAKEEKKEKKKRAPRSKSPAKAVKPTAASERPKRETKEVKKFEMSASSGKAKPDVLQGKGKELGKIENITTALGKVLATDKAIAKLYNVIYPGAAKTKHDTKKYIKQFSGFAGEDVKQLKENAIEKLAKTDVATLKKLAAILDIETSGTKSELAESIGDFLEKPKSSGRDYKPIGRTSASKKGKGTKRKSSDKPRKVSGYILFTTSIRADVVKKNKNAAPKEIMGLLAAEWKDLSESEQNKWKKKAEKAAPVASKKKKSSTKKNSKKDESDGDAVDESEDGDDEEAEGEGDDEEEVEEEEEKEEPKAKKAKKGSKKGSTKKKGSNKGSSKGKGKKGSKKADGGDEKKNENAEVEKKLAEAIGEILKDADLTQTTLASVKKLLAEKKFDEATIKANKDFIKQTVDDKIST